MKTSCGRNAALRAVVVVCLGWGAPAVHAAISGNVFRDFNADGARAANGGEPGVGGVTITAYPPSGTPVSTVSNLDGSYTLATSAGVNYRLEMTGQASHFFLGAAGTAGATSDVRFAADGSTGINFGVNNPAQYCSSAANADVVNAQLVRNQQTPNGVQTIGSWDYQTSSTAAVGTQTTWAMSETVGTTQNGTGSIWGLAYRRLGDTLFSASFMRRGSPQGDDHDSVGAIYRSVRVGATITTTLFADLNAAAYNSIDLGTNPHPRASTPDFTRDTNASWANVGKVGFGDIDISEDESTLYAINLFQRELLLIPLGSGVTPTVPASDASIVRRPVPFPAGCNAASASSAAPSQADLRPFALEVFDGKVYVGAVCTAQSMLGAGATLANARAAMRAYVFRFDPVSNSFEDFDPSTPAVVDPFLTANLDYNRRFVNDGAAFANSGPWLPWSDTVPATVPTGYGTAGTFYAYPQPMLADISIDGFGFMTLGFADRHGYQAFDTDDPGPPNYTAGGTFNTRTGGEILLACEQTNGSWTLESNGSCTASATGITRTTGDPQANGAGSEDNTTSGPGGREFYFAERFEYRLSTPGTDSAMTGPDYHRETADGALVHLHGSGSVGAAVYDVGAAFNNGVRFFRTGAVAESASPANLMTNVGGVAEAPLAPNGTAVHEFRATDGGIPRFGKANGMGDIEILCDLPPIQIGNRVWNDANYNGVQDGDEAGISGVTVRLYRGSDGAQLGQVVTDAGGNYMFLLIQAATTTTGGTSATVNISYADLYGQTVIVGLPGTNGSGVGTGTLGVATSLALTLPDVDTGANREARDSDATPFDPPGAPTAQAAITVNLPTRPGDNRFDADFGLTLLADQGDLPDLGSGSGPGNYRTVKAGGPIALVTATARINTAPDAELNGQPTTSANGDGSDEDGITNTAGTWNLAVGGSLNSVQVSNVLNNTGATAQLCGFIDLNGDGDFSDANEKQTLSLASSATASNRTLNFGVGSIPATSPNITYARFRLIQGASAVCPTAAGTDGGANGFGVGLTAAVPGEVEDYRVAISGLNADVQVSLTDFSCTPGASDDFTITVTNPETLSGGGQGATLNLATMTYVVPAEFARMDWNVGTLTGGATCVSGCSGSLTSISGSPGTITAQLYMPTNGDAVSPSVTFALQGIVRHSVASGTNIVNTATVSQPAGLGGDVLANNTSAVPALCTPPTTFNTAICALPGKDTPPSSDATVISSPTVVNTYYTPRSGFTGTIAAGAASECLPLDGTATVAGAPFPVASFTTGDLLLVMQMQDGSYNSTDDATYGGTLTDAADDGSGFTSLDNGGRYEFVQVDGPPGTLDCPANTLPITGSGVEFGLLHSYVHNPTATPRRVVQFVRVPQYKGLILSGSGRLDALAWNGLTGGIVAADVRDTLDLGSGATCKVDASQDGFRGGGVNAVTTGAGNSTSMRALLTTGSGVKGEGLVGSPERAFNGTSTLVLTAPGYVNGSARKGAPGNAGGGGNSCATAGDNNNSHNSGGGGGGNGGLGGKGGSNLRGTRLCSNPNNNGGGIGGAALTNLPELLGMGGGGGSGGVTTANGNNSAGGLGGGVVIIRANAVVGTGDMCASGSAGQSATNNNNAGGGGGAGGSVLLFSNIAGASNFSGLRLFAAGGNGGAGNGASNQEGGGGGGGGSGRIFLSALPGAISTLSLATGTGGVGGAAGNSEDGSQPAAFALIGGTNTDLNPYNSTPGAKPGFLCSSGTVPVTLSDVASRVEGSSLVVDFGTASEAGTVGFYVHGDLPGGVRMLLSNQMTMGAGDSLIPQRYQVRGAWQGQSTLWIEEVAIDGRSTFYGPYPVGGREGESNLAVATDWPAVRAEQRALRSRLATAVLGSARGAQLDTEIRVQQSGWLRLSYEDLLAIGVDYAGVPIAQLQITRAGVPVGVVREGAGAFGPGQALSFHAEALDTQYTDTQVYRLQVIAGSGLTLQGVFAGAGALPPVTQARAVYTHAPNRLYSFSSPLDDPWYAARVVRNGTPSASVSEVFSLPAKAPVSGTERLLVEVWGGLDYDQAPDHSLRILLNGTQVATRRFDGIQRELIEATLPSGVLQSGANTLTVELIGDTGLATDVVHLESIRVEYDRQLVAVNDTLDYTVTGVAGPLAAGDRIYTDDFSTDGITACAASAAGCTAYTIAGVHNPDVAVLRIRDGVALRMNGVRVEPVGGSFNLHFAQTVQEGDRFLLQPGSATTTATLAPAVPVSDPLQGGPASYLIVAHPAFMDGLAPLIAARQAEGFSVRVLDVEDLYRWYSGGVVDPQAVSNALRDAWRRLGTRYVLLVGGDTYDYRNRTNVGSLSFIPSWYRAVGPIVRHAPADGVYADYDADGRMDLAIGRWPVRTAAELQVAVDKTLAYGSRTPDGKALLLSDRDQNSVSFRDVQYPLSARLGPNYDAHMLSLQSYPSGGAGVTQARNDLVAALNSGQALLSFFGHSAPSSWTREGLITASLVYGGLFQSNPPTAVWQLGCWGAYYVEPRYNTVAHGMLLQSGGGAAVVLGASGLTEIASDTAWMNLLAPRLGNQRVGDAVRDTQRELHQRGAELIDVSVGATLLGDPALRLR